MRKKKHLNGVSSAAAHAGVRYVGGHTEISGTALNTSRGSAVLTRSVVWCGVAWCDVVLLCK